MATRSLSRMGLDPRTVHRLSMRSIHTVQDLLGRTQLDLIETIDITSEAVDALVEDVSEKICPTPVTLFELVQRRAKQTTHLPTFLPLMDAALRGGISASAITEFVGPAGIGKTQMCLMLSVIACMPKELGGGGGSTIYVDTESKFSSARLVEIATGHFPQCYHSAESIKDLTNRIMVLTPRSSQELLERLRAMEAVIIERRVQLLIIDSIAALPRVEFDNTQIMRRQEMLGQQAARLKFLAESFCIPIVVTNQVTTSFGTTPFPD